MTKRSAQQLKKTTAMATQVIRHHFGKTASRIVYKPTGLTNDVFEVVFDKKPYIVRIANEPGKINDFLKEQWVTTRLKKTGIPVAEILEVGMESIPRPYMIQEKVEGVTGTDCADRLTVIREMGEYAAKINSVRTRNFGRNFEWSNNRLSRNTSWTDYLENEFDYPGRIRLLKEYKLLTPAMVNKLSAYIRKIKRWRKPPVLNHGDLRLKNIIVNGKGRIVAILDWERCTSNVAPWWELSHALHDLGVDEKEAFLQGYGLSRKEFAEMSFAIKTFNILNYAVAIKEVGAKKDSSFTEECRLRFKGHYDLFSLA